MVNTAARQIPQQLLFIIKPFFPLYGVSKKLTRILANRFSISLTSLGMGCCLLVSPLVDALKVLVRIELVSCDLVTRVVGRALRVLPALLWPPPSTDGGPLDLPLRLPIFGFSADSTWFTHTRHSDETSRLLTWQRKPPTHWRVRWVSSTRGSRSRRPDKPSPREDLRLRVRSRTEISPPELLRRHRVWQLGEGETLLLLLDECPDSHCTTHTQPQHTVACCVVACVCILILSSLQSNELPAV